MDNLDLLVPEKVRWSERLVNSDQSRNKIIKELKYELKEEIYKKWCIEQIKECHDISSNVIIMSHEILYREYTINTNTNATEYERRIDEIVHGILYLDALHPVQTILPNIKDNFGCMVRFVEIVCNFQLSDHLPPYKAIYIKDRINPSNDYLQGEIVTVLIKCFFTTGTGYRRTVRNGLGLYIQINNNNDDKNKNKNKNKNNKNNKIFLPCFPSEIDVALKYPIKYMDDIILWNNLEMTIHLLNIINENTTIPCKPLILVRENSCIIGLLTETNQFIQLSEPEIYYEEYSNKYGLKIIDDMNYLIADKIMTTSITDNKLRIDTIKLISIEQQCYNAFKSMVRKNLNSSNYIDLRNKILVSSTSKNTFKKKLKEVILLLHELLDSYVLFQKIDHKVLMSFNEISRCEQTKENTSDYCLSIDNDNQIILPKHNLFTNEQNETLYFTKMADELIRNKRSQLYMLDPNYVVTSPNIQYSVYNNELLLLKSLSDEIYKNSVPINNEYIQNISYDNTKPLFYNDQNPYVNLNTIILPIESESKSESKSENEVNLESIKECINNDVSNNVIGNSKSVFRFPNSYKEFFFKNHSTVCSYSSLIYILIMESNNKQDITIRYIQNILCKGYDDDKYTIFKDVIIDILKKQGKTSFMNKIIKKELTLHEVIMSPEYFITDLDVWIISMQLKLPIILFNSTSLKPFNRKWIYLSSDKNDYEKPLYFLRSPSSKYLNYSLILPKINYTDLIGDILLEFEKTNLLTLDSFLSSYTTMLRSEN